MIEAITFWNEPNNLSHWDFEIDTDWRHFTEMTLGALHEVRSLCPGVTRVLGGLSPIDPDFVRLLDGYGLIA